MSESDGNTALLPEADMRALGFTDRRPDYWYFTKRVGSNESMNFTINKANGNYEELVMDEMFGQPAYYGHMRPNFRDEIRANVDTIVGELNAAGLTVAVDHKAYGVNA